MKRKEEVSAAYSITRRGQL